MNIPQPAMQPKRLRLNAIVSFIRNYWFDYAVLILVVLTAILIPTWFICKKAGFSPWLAFITLIPVGHLILLYVLAFADWKVVPAPQAYPHIGMVCPSGKVVLVGAAVSVTALWAKTGAAAVRRTADVAASTDLTRPALTRWRARWRQTRRRSPTRS